MNSAARGSTPANTKSRRWVLFATATIPFVSSGCALDPYNDSSLSLHFEPVTDSNLGDEFLYTTADWSELQQELVNEGVPNGTTTSGHRPFRTGDFIEVDGTYYEISVTENGRTPVKTPLLVATPVEEPDGNVGDFGTLSDTDVETLRCALSTAREGEKTRPCPIFGGESSSFLPKPAFEFIEHGSRYYRLSVETKEVPLEAYEYEFTAIAETQTEFAEFAARELIAVDFDAMDLSEKQRKILRTGTETGVYEESPPPYTDALTELVEVFEDSADAHRDYIRFEGGYYLMWTMSVHDD